MENNDRRQRQNNPPGYAGQQGLIQTPTQYPVTSASDRYRQAPLTAQSPTSAPSTGSRANPQGYGYAYGEGTQFVGSAIQPAGLPYPPEYAQEQQRASQQYPQYGQNIMYNVPPQQAAAPQSPYEAVQPYQQPRQSAAIEVLSTQFGVPQQYYVAGEGGPTSAPATAMATQNVPSQYPPLGYTTQQSPVRRETLAPAYAAGMNDPNQGSSQGAFSQSNYAAQGGSEFDTAYNQYQTELKRTFQHVRDGRLSDAGTLLLNISEWLLGNAESLVRDDEAMHAERLKLWDEFNTCWLSTLQRQKEMTQEMLDSGQRPQPPQSLIEYENLEGMGKNLVRLCDIMEKHGLVDYQMGVWEEEIVAMLSTCLDLLEGVQGSASTSQRAASAATSRRR
ncbi:hypothetical protein K432DRAFT_73632 [Lepidopterella palustris CBS 459.81]|uniref:Uncharacterized protein n=1 Tax=Lepidopterella palustris CBS 459.81 TaxID=1314670 RepID=A0A8E2EKB8_9PEZI|nr:hypothetical protein K432DRAFT_73632 [Lepidopterella palustris CBS 459.81]